MEPTDNQDNSGPLSSNILDKIMGSQTQSNLNEFQPLTLVVDLLAELKERDREILGKRFGLNGQEIETLEAIGKKFNLTRERVRQIEKDSLSNLKKKKTDDLDRSLQLIADTIIEHGNIISEDMLMQAILVSKSDPREIQAVRFLFNLGDQFKNLKPSEKFVDSWYIVGFDLNKLHTVAEEFKKILTTAGHVMPQEHLHQKFRNTDYFKQHETELPEKALKSYLGTLTFIQLNPFSEIGLKNWSEVKPRDVGDKAYLVLKHHGKPEHYSLITKMVNNSKFDERTAFQETVHNELIKDNRFVLVGRGIYALAEWGFKKGVVADVIKYIIKSAGHPLSRDEIMQEVMKQRQVKRNTILVALSNKKNFMRTNNDKYNLAPETQS